MAGNGKSVREEVVPRTEIQKEERDPLRCPRCHGQDYVTYGNIHRAHTETYQAGELTSQESDMDLLVHEIEALECTVCHIRFVIRPDEVFQMERELMNLREQLGVGPKPC